MKYRLSVLILLLLAIAASGSAAQDSGIRETVLPNGLMVLTKEVHAAPVFNLTVWYRLGSRNENIGETGMTHLLEHMLFKGSKHFKKGEATRLIRSRGGVDNGSTWLDFTNYYELMSSEHLELALKIEADRMSNALIAPEEFKSEMVVVRSELEGRENDPGDLLRKEFNAVAYRQHPYRWPVIGWREDVEGVTRDEVYRYYKDHYGPNNAVLVLVGDFETEKALGLIRKHFGGIKPVKSPKPVRTVEPPQRGEKRVELRGKGAAHRVMIGYHAVSASDPDSYPLSVADQILSGGRSSRLYQALVEQGLAVSAWSSITPTRDPSLFTIGAVGQKDVTADRLEAALLAEVEKLKTEPISDEELQRAKNQIEAYFTFNKDSVSDQAEQIGFFEIVSTWKLMDEYVPNVRAVTKEDVQRVAHKYFTDLNRTVAKFIPSEPGPEGSLGQGSGPAHYRPVSGLGASCQSSVDGGRFEIRESARSTLNAQASTQVPRPFRTVLPNGLVLIIHENHSNTTIAISGSVNAGSYFDPPGKEGTAQMTADMLERGTLKRSSLDIAKELDFVGASSSVNPGVESVRFSGQALTKDFGLAMDILSDMLRNPTFPSDQLEKLRSEAVSRLQQERESPDDMAQRAFGNKLYPSGHPYHTLTIDDAIKAIQSISRDDLVAFHSKRYSPNGTILVVVGDVTPESALAAVQKHFGDWPIAENLEQVIIPDVPLPEKAERIIVNMPDKAEAAILFGHPSGITRKSPDYYAYVLMNQVLGGGGALASRLGKKIRDDMGLAYDVFSAFGATLGQGAWYTSIGCNPVNVDKAVAALQDELRRYASEGPTKEEFEEAKRFVIGYFPIGLETNAGIARVLLNAEFYGLGMDYIQKYPAIYRAVTLDQAKQMAQKYLHPDRGLLVVAGSREPS